jgi:thiol-disulfide isomerase/thioredoxin
MKISIYILLTLIASSLLWYYSDALLYTVNAFPFLTWVVADVLLRLFIVIIFSASLFYLLSLLLKRFNKFLLLAMAFVLGFLISLINPVYVDDYGIAQRTNLPLDVDIVNHYFQDSTLNSGYVVVAFFSTSCVHCKHTSKQFAINTEKKGQPKTIVCFPSSKTDAATFLEKTNANFDYRLVTLEHFIGNAGRAFPSVFLLKDRKVLHQWVGSEINYSVLDYLSNLEN